jgi:hypothetical protein
MTIDESIARIQRAVDAMSPGAERTACRVQLRRAVGQIARRLSAAADVAERRKPAK